MSIIEIIQHQSHLFTVMLTRGLSCLRISKVLKVFPIYIKCYSHFDILFRSFNSDWYRIKEILWLCLATISNSYMFALFCRFHDENVFLYSWLMSFDVLGVSQSFNFHIYIYIYIWGKKHGLFLHRDHIRDQELTVKAKTSEQLVYFHGLEIIYPIFNLHLSNMSLHMTLFLHLILTNGSQFICIYI